MKKIAAFLLAGVLMCQAGTVSSATTSMLWLDERESNNSPSEASTFTAFPEQRGIIGLVNEYDKKDCFDIKALRDGEIEIRFEYRRADSDFMAYVNCDNFDSGFNESETLSFRGSDGRDRVKMKVKRGDVINVRVNYMNGYMTQPYKLRYRMR